MGKNLEAISADLKLQRESLEEQIRKDDAATGTTAELLEKIQQLNERFERTSTRHSK